MKKDLHNPADAKDIQEVIRKGVTTEFWQLIVEDIEDKIALVEVKLDSDALSNLEAREYKIKSEILKAERGYLMLLKELPNTLIMSLDEPDQTEPRVDPYDKPQDIDEDSK